MPSCVVKGCKNYDTKVKKEHGISYHRFPNEIERQEIWNRIIRKQRKEPYFLPHKNTRVCSAHFCDEDVDISKAGLRKLKGSAIPRINIEVCENEELRASTPEQSSESEDEEEFIVQISDLKSMFDTPRKSHLKKRINKLERRQKAAAKKIKSLKKQNCRLRKRNHLMLHIIKDFKQKKYITEEIQSALGRNGPKTD